MTHTIYFTWTPRQIGFEAESSFSSSPFSTSFGKETLMNDKHYSKFTQGLSSGLPTVPHLTQNQKWNGSPYSRPPLPSGSYPYPPPPPNPVSQSIHMRGRGTFPSMQVLPYHTSISVRQTSHLLYPAPYPISTGNTGPTSTTSSMQLNMTKTKEELLNDKIVKKEIILPSEQTISTSVTSSEVKPPIKSILKRTTSVIVERSSSPNSSLPSASSPIRSNSISLPMVSKAVPTQAILTSDSSVQRNAAVQPSSSQSLALSYSRVATTPASRVAATPASRVATTPASRVATTPASRVATTPASRVAATPASRVASTPASRVATTPPSRVTATLVTVPTIPPSRVSATPHYTTSTPPSCVATTPASRVAATPPSRVATTPPSRVATTTPLCTAATTPPSRVTATLLDTTATPPSHVSATPLSCVTVTLSSNLQVASSCSSPVSMHCTPPPSSGGHSGVVSPQEPSSSQPPPSSSIQRKRPNNMPLSHKREDSAPKCSNLRNTPSPVSSTRKSVISPVVKQEQNYRSGSPKVHGSTGSDDSDSSYDLDWFKPECCHADLKALCHRDGVLINNLLVCIGCSRVLKQSAQGSLEPVPLNQGTAILLVKRKNGPYLIKLDPKALIQLYRDHKDEDHSECLSEIKLISVVSTQSKIPSAFPTLKVKARNQKLVQPCSQEDYQFVEFEEAVHRPSVTVGKEKREDEPLDSPNMNMSGDESSPMPESSSSSLAGCDFTEVDRQWTSELLNEYGYGLPGDQLGLLQEFSPVEVAQWKKMKTKRSTGETPLHTACARGYEAMARYFLTIEGMSVTVRDNAGWTPLHEACSHGHRSLVKLLLDAGANLSACARDGTMPIHDAVESGNLEVVKLLVEYDVEVTPDSGEQLPIAIARKKGFREIEKYLEDVAQERKVENEKRNSLAQSTSFSLGPELDCPLFMTSPVFDETDRPLPKAYNLRFPSIDSKRYHNFYLMQDLTAVTNLSEEGILEALKETNVKSIEMNVEIFRPQVKSSQMYKLPCCYRHINKDKVVKLVPDCKIVRNILGIHRTVLDDF